MRAVLRFVASVMMVSGALLITDAVVTLLWQEPVSAFVAEREQAALKDALFDPPERVLRREPLEGDSIARIEIPAIGVSEYVVEGTDTGDLRKGPGHYPDTPLPGERGTAAIAGHRTTYGAPFRNIDDLKRGAGDPRGHARRALRLPRGADQDRGRPGPVGARAGRLRAADAERLPPALQRRRAGDRLRQAGAAGGVAGQALVTSGVAAPSMEDWSRDSKKRIRPMTSASETASTASQ